VSQRAEETLNRRLKSGSMTLMCDASGNTIRSAPLICSAIDCDIATGAP
jgi:hypothetical protein